MQKILTFRDNDILSIEINYQPLDDKKINEFYEEVACAFLKYCKRRLYKSAAENFLLSEQSDEKAFEIFTTKIDFTAEYEALDKLNNKLPNIKIHLDININGEKRHKIYSLTNIIIKKKKRKSEEKIFETDYLR